MVRNKRFILKVFILIWTYSLSLQIFWDIISAICGFNRFYVIFQLLYAGIYTMTAIAMTKDWKYIEDAWNKDGWFKKIYNQLLHYSAIIVLIVPIVGLLIVAALSSDDSTQRKEYVLQEVKKAVDGMDESPVAVRSLFPFGAMAVCLSITIGFNVLPENILFWIQEIIATLVSLISLVVVILNAIEAERDME